MSTAAVVVILILAAIETLAAYISRVYSEFGKILSREVQENLDIWEESIEPHLALTREHAAISAQVAQQLALGLIALVFGALLFDHGGRVQPSAGEIVQALLGVVLVIVFCGQVLPWLLFERTQGRWAARILWLIRLLLWSMTPITVLIRFFFSLVSLAEEPATREEEAAVDVEALLEAGEEEGILEETDRDLVRSAVEFGDKLVKEVMTPRPRVFAVRDSMTLEQFLAELKVHNYSRVPGVFGLARQHHGNRVCPRPAADFRRGGAHAHGGQHPAAGGICAGDQEGLRAAARDAAREAAHAHRHRRVWRRRGSGHH